MSLGSVQLKSKIRDYSVYFSEKPDFFANLAAAGNSLFIVDAKVWDLHKEGCLKSLAGCDIILLPVNERRKSLRSVEKLYDGIMAYSPKRNTRIVSIGGGVTQDITGFVASTLFRGINWIYVPTTLLAQTDSCIGAKTSLNYGKFKNLLGTFYPPVEIYIHSPFLKTQKRADFFSGLGESAKLHMIGGEADTLAMIELMPLLVRNDGKAILRVIKRSLIIKKDYIEGDEFDTGKRNMLNFGHCFGHALETVNDFKIPHGQAVVLGIMLANLVAEKRGIMSAAREEFFAGKLLRPIIRTDLGRLITDGAQMIEAMGRDKKRVGPLLPLVMIDDAYGMFKVNDLTDREVNRALSDFRSRYIG